MALQVEMCHPSRYFKSYNLCRVRARTISAFPRAFLKQYSNWFSNRFWVMNSLFCKSSRTVFTIGESFLRKCLTSPKIFAWDSGSMIVCLVYHCSNRVLLLVHSRHTLENSRRSIFLARFSVVESSAFTVPLCTVWGTLFVHWDVPLDGFPCADTFFGTG